MKKKEHKHHQSGMKHPSMIAKTANPESWKYYVTLAIIFLLSFIAYFPALKNGFVWDDGYYIINNNLIRDLSWKGIRAIFNNFSSDNYAPLTDLINAVQYKISGLSPTAFHFGSLIFHLLNVALVFWFIKLLCSNWGIAAITALFFGIHPIQVESVAWASGGSNLFCAAFFLGSLVAYLYYLRQSLKRYLFISFLFFILSLLSKALAVVLPIVLLLIDYYRDRKITIKILLEKSPFLMLSLGAGILFLLLKNHVGVIGGLTMFSFPQRLVFASYGFITYLFKLLFPINLSAYYPYPMKNGVDIPIHYYVFILFFLGLAVYTIYSLRFSKKFFFGMGFFAINVFLVLQLLPFGKVIIADRYSYIPSIGIFYLVGEGFTLLCSKKLKLATIILLSVSTVLFSVKTYARCGVWKNDMTLWNDVICQYKTKENVYYIEDVYYNRGTFFMNEKRNDEAINDFNKAIELKPDYADAYNNRGNVFMNEKRNDEAINDFNKAIQLKPHSAYAYNNRGYLFMNEKKISEAINDFNKAIQLKPDFAEKYNNRGYLFIIENRNSEAINDFNKAIQLKPDFAEAYNYLGIVFVKEKRNSEAINNFNKAIELKPDFDYAYYNRGNLFMNEKRDSEAINDFNKAIQLKPDFAEAYFKRGNLFMNVKRNSEAINDFNKAIQLKPDYAKAYNNRGIVFVNEKRNSEAINDFNKAIQLKPDFAEAYNNKGNFFLKEKRYEEAIRIYTKAIALKTDYAQAYYSRGVAEFYLSKKDAACMDLKQAASLGYKSDADALSQICK